LGELNGMSSQSHVSNCRVLPLDEFNVMIPEPHATLQGVRIPSAILKIVFRHILFISSFFKCSFGFDERKLSHRLRYRPTCLYGCTVYNVHGSANQGIVSRDCKIYREFRITGGVYRPINKRVYLSAFPFPLFLSNSHCPALKSSNEFSHE